MRALATALLLALAACHPRAPTRPALAPLEEEGEVHLFVAPFPAEAERLSFTIASIAAVGADGRAAPLELHLRDLSAEAASRQRLLASGRLAPGAYAALEVRVSRAALRTPAGSADLHLPERPEPLPVSLHVVARRATVLVLALRFERAVSASYGFTPAFSSAEPAAPVAQLAGYATSPAAAAVAVLDKRRRASVAVLPTGAEPRGMAVDVTQRRAYVALAGADQIQILDLDAGEELGRIQLRPGDRPQEVALTPDGRTLVVTNPGSRTASFVDPASKLERERVPVGDDPHALLLDRLGQRAYVSNRRTATITVLEVGRQAVAGTISTDPEPLRAQLNRSGTRLYVPCAGSAYLAAYSLPDLAPAGRLHVGLGVSALRIDPRTDLLYVGRRDEAALAVFDPAAFLAVDRIPLPGAPSLLVVDDLENTLYALVPEAGEVAVVDLTRRRVVAEIDVLPDPHGLALAGERN